MRKVLIKRPPGAGDHKNHKNEMDELEWPLEARKKVIQNTPDEIFDALRKIVEYARKPDPSSSLVMQNLIEQSIFCLTPDRLTTRLTPVNQFKLLNAIAASFQFDVRDDVTRKLFFVTLFLGRANDNDYRASHEGRMSVLVRLSSLAVQYPLGPFLDCVGIWLAEEFQTNDIGQRIALELISSFVLKPPEWDLGKFVDNLIHSAFSFAAVFMLHAIDVNFVKETRGHQLLTQIAKWLSSEWSKLLTFYNTYSVLGRDFAQNRFPYLLALNCTNNFTDDVHERLHVGVISVLVKARTLLPNAPLNLEVLEKLKVSEVENLNSVFLSEVLIAAEREID